MGKYASEIRWGIIGCGDVTEVKSGPAYKQTKGFQLNAVMRRDFEKLKDYAKRHEIGKYYTDADQLINDDEIDAVYIATPPDTHLQYALKVAAVGKICCIEKPLAPTYKESAAIYEAFKQNNVPLFTAYYRRSLPRFLQVKKWLTNNQIGTIRHVNLNLCKAPSELDLSQAYNWRTDPKVAPGGYFDDLASHGLDLITFYLGNIETVFGISINQQNLYQSKDAIVACWQHESGATGVGNWNFGGNRTEDRVEIIGSTGTIQFSVFEENPLFLKSTALNQEIFIENPKAVQLPHVENMKRQLFEENFTHPSNGATATHTSWVMDRILGVINE